MGLQHEAISGIDGYRRQLGIPDDVHAVNAGSWGPLCESARAAMSDFVERDSRLRVGDHSLYMQAIYNEIVETDRECVAGLLGCGAAEVALCESTTAALNIVLWGLDLAPGEEVVSSRLENPAAVVPLRTVAARRGVSLRWLDLGSDSIGAAEALTQAISAKTRLLLLSDVDFATGSRVDLPAICRIAHEHGVFVLADGAQAVGTVEVDVKALGADAYAFARHKFLCGPDGAGALYLSENAVAPVSPTFTGVFSDEDHGMGEADAIFTTSHRFDVSTRGIASIVGGSAAVAWLEEIGLEVVRRETAARREAVRTRLQDIDGVQLISPPTSNGGLLTFSVEGVSPTEVLRQLATCRIFGRTIVVTAPHGVRLSIGFWTRAQDVDRIAEAVAEIAALGTTGRWRKPSSRGDSQPP